MTNPACLSVRNMYVLWKDIVTHLALTLRITFFRRARQIICFARNAGIRCILASPYTHQRATSTYITAAPPTKYERNVMHVDSFDRDARENSIWAFSYSRPVASISRPITRSMLYLCYVLYTAASFINGFQGSPTHQLQNPMTELCLRCSSV